MENNIRTRVILRDQKWSVRRIKKISKKKKIKVNLIISHQGWKEAYHDGLFASETKIDDNTLIVYGASKSAIGRINKYRKAGCMVETRNHNNICFE